MGDSVTRAKAHGFLEERNMTAGHINMDLAVRMFRDEMRAGLSGTGSSLQMIPTYLSPEGEIPTDTPVLVLDAGGTNFRVAQIFIDSQGDPHILNFKKYSMPGSRSPVDRETFFNSIVDYMKDILDTWEGDEPPCIGFCFSYPTEIYPDRDGRLLHFSKEIKASEVEGQLIGANLIRALTDRGYRKPRKIVLLNDTVATLLAGKATTTGPEFDSFVGFILGTGTNSAYIESNSNIRKLGSAPAAGAQIINIESGNLNCIQGGSLDAAFDATTERPGFYRFEKMVSGAYLGPLCGAVLQEAARSGLFSNATAENLLSMNDIDTITIDTFLHHPARNDNRISAACRNDHDRMIAFILSDNMIERAAKLSAVNIAATVLQEGSGDDPSRPVAVCADGTTLFKTRDLLFRTRYYLKQYLEEKHSRYVQIVQQDDAPIIGSAVAALLSTRG